MLETRLQNGHKVNKMNNRHTMTYIFKKITTAVIFWLIPLTLIILIRLIIDQSYWLKMADNSYQAKNYIQAIAYNDRVLQAYIPFSSNKKTASNNLLKIAEWAEKNNEKKLAMISIETLKSSLLYTQHLWSSNINTNPSPNPFSFILMLGFLIAYLISAYFWLIHHSIKLVVCTLGCFAIWCILLKMI